MLAASIPPLITSSKGKPDVLLWKEGAGRTSIATKPPVCHVLQDIHQFRKQTVQEHKVSYTGHRNGSGSLAKDLGTTSFFVKVCAGPLYIRAIVFRSFLDQHPASQSTAHTGCKIHLILQSLCPCLSQCIGLSLEPENVCTVAEG